MATPRTARAVAERLRDVLATYLQTEVDDTADAEGCEESVLVGTVDYTRTTEPALRPGSVQVSIDSSEDLEQVRNYGAPIRRLTRLIVRAQIGHVIGRDLDELRDIVADAIARVAHVYLRRDGNPAAVQLVEASTLQELSATRSGNVGMRGGTLEDAIEIVEVELRVTHCVDMGAPF